MTSVAVKVPSTVRVIFDGQSLLNTPDEGTHPEAFRKVPELLMQGRTISYVNVAVSGNGWYDRAAAGTLRPQIRNREDCFDILVMFGGQGDILNPAPSGGQTGATCYARAVAYKDQAVAWGVHRVIIGSLPAMGPNMLGSGRPTGPEQAAFMDLNELILGNSGDFDEVVDVYRDPMNDATNTVYFEFDRLHIVEPGAHKIAEFFAPALERQIRQLLAPL